MPVGWGCRGGGRGCRRGVAVLVVGYRSRRAVTDRVAGCGGRAAASCDESDRGCSGRRRSSGCVVAFRRARSTARCVVAGGSVWSLQRLCGRSDAGTPVRRTVETGCVPGRRTLGTGCVGVQWCGECGGCQRVRGGTCLHRTWSGNGGVCA